MQVLWHVVALLDAQTSHHLYSDPTFRLPEISTYGPFDRKRVFGVISGNLRVCAPNNTLVFNTSLTKNAH